MVYLIKMYKEGWSGKNGKVKRLVYKEVEATDKKEALIKEGKKINDIVSIYLKLN